MASMDDLNRKIHNEKERWSVRNMMIEYEGVLWMLD
jgi:hypothetical protein